MLDWDYAAEWYSYAIWGNGIFFLLHLVFTISTKLFIPIMMNLLASGLYFLSYDAYSPINIEEKLKLSKVGIFSGYSCWILSIINGIISWNLGYDFKNFILLIELQLPMAQYFRLQLIKIFMGPFDGAFTFVSFGGFNILMAIFCITFGSYIYGLGFKNKHKIKYENHTKFSLLKKGNIIFLGIASILFGGICLYLSGNFKKININKIYLNLFFGLYELFYSVGLIAICIGIILIIIPIFLIVKNL